MDIEHTDPVTNKRLGFKTPRSILLPPYLAYNNYFIEFADSIDAVFASNIDAQIDILSNIRNMWVTNPVFEQDVIDGLIHDLESWTKPSRDLLVKQVNLLGMKLRSAGIISDIHYLALSRFLGQYWFEKGTDKFIEFINFTLATNITIDTMWTEDYKNFYMFSDPFGYHDIGTPIYEGGTWYPTTHVTLTAEYGDLANADLESLTTFFYEIANYNLVLHAIDINVRMWIVDKLAPGHTTADIVALGLIMDTAIVLLTYVAPPTVDAGAYKLQIHLTDSVDPIVYLNITSSGVNNIDWGDGSPLAVATSVNTHSYDPGTYVISIDGDAQAISIGNSNISSVIEFGTFVVNKFEYAAGLGRCTSLISMPPELPVNVTSTANMFNNLALFNGDISGWDTSSITDMSYMFYGAHAFNRDISGWNVSNVVNMDEMFSDATAFNQDIGIWKTGNVVNMNYMFNAATSFNRNLNGWCVTNIPTAPTGFSTDTPAWLLDKPIWGTCPGAATSDTAIFGGGITTATITKYTDKYSYINDTVTPGTELGLARSNLAAVGNSTVGVFAGGITTASVAYTDRYQYIDDTVSSGTLLNEIVNHGAACGIATVGLFNATLTVPSIISYTDKYTYATDDVSAGTALAMTSSSIAATGNTTDGYFAGGLTAASNVSNTTNKYTYSSNIVGASTNLSAPRYGLAACGIATLGLFAGGNPNIPGTLSNVTDVYTYATDAVVSGASLSNSVENLAAASNSTVGIFAGGNDSAGTVTDASSLFTYSTSAVTTSVLLGQKRNALAASSNSHGGL